ncbi:MAG: hypothetical protein R3D02_10560 [Hyphomicrobiales bacterium]
MKLKEPNDFDLNEVRYSALNCKNGIIASMLRDFQCLDITPVYAGLHVAFADIVAPMTKGDIAGAHLGGFDQSVWAGLFSVDWLSQPVPADVDEFRLVLADTLAAVGPVLAPHDGYYDENAADKYRRVHALHNAMIYGMTDDGTGLHIADRYLRVVMPIEVFHEALVSQGAPLLGIRACKPYQGDWSTLLARLRQTISARLPVRADLDLVGPCLDAIRSDGPGAPAERWLQAHSYLKAVGASRAFAADLVRALATRGLVSGGDADAFTTAFDRWAEDWNLASALAYKFMAAGQEKTLVRVRERLEKVVGEEIAEMHIVLTPLDASIAAE